jgi:hypothetical protein
MTKAKPLFFLSFPFDFVQLLSQRKLVEWICSLALDNSPWSLPIKAILKSTAARQFIAGESIEDAVSTATRLFRRKNVYTILNHSTEEMKEEEAFFLNVDRKKQLILQAGSMRSVNRHRHRANAQGQALEQEQNQDQEQIVRFVPIKCTSLVSPHVLECISKLPNVDHLELSDILEGEVISGKDRLSLLSGVAHLRGLCDAAAATGGVALLLDAEQSHRQPAIEIIARALSKEYNSLKKSDNKGNSSSSSGDMPVIFNTYQVNIYIYIYCFLYNFCTLFRNICYCHRCTLNGRRVHC